MTPDQLVNATNCTRTAAIAFASPIATAIKRWGVQSVAEFVAQMAVESARFTRLQENLSYRTPERLIQVFGTRYFPTRELAQKYVGEPELLANYVYDDRNPARRNKLGNTQPGDGWRYRGRGLKQLTGRSNYAAYQEATGVQVLDSPDLLLDPVFAADSAGWYWRTNNCDALADDVEQLTRRINGGLNGLHDRVALTELAREVLA